MEQLEQVDGRVDARQPSGKHNKKNDTSARHPPMTPDYPRACHRPEPCGNVRNAATPVSVLLKPFVIARVPHMQRGRQVREQQNQRCHHTNGAKCPKFLDRDDATPDKQRHESECCGAGCQRAGEPAVSQCRFRSAVKAAFANCVAIIIHDMYGARQPQHIHQRRHRHQDGVRRLA